MQLHAMADLVDGREVGRGSSWGYASASRQYLPSNKKKIFSDLLDLLRGYEYLYPLPHPGSAIHQHINTSTHTQSNFAVLDTMTDTKLRIGILGAARIARKNAIAISHPESACVVAAIASRTPAKAEVRAPRSSIVVSFCLRGRHETNPFLVVILDDGFSRILLRIL